MNSEEKVQTDAGEQIPASIEVKAVEQVSVHHVQQRKETPAVLGAFPSIKRGRTEFKLRVLRFRKSEPLLDIREYARYPEQGFTGFTKKGITLNAENLVELEKLLPEIRKVMDEA